MEQIQKAGKSDGCGSSGHVMLFSLKHFVKTWPDELL